MADYYSPTVIEPNIPRADMSAVIIPRYKCPDYHLELTPGLAGGFFCPPSRVDRPSAQRRSDKERG